MSFSFLWGGKLKEFRDKYEDKREQSGYKVVEKVVNDSCARLFGVPVCRDFFKNWNKFLFYFFSLLIREYLLIKRFYLNVLTISVKFQVYKHLEQRKNILEK